MLYIVWEFVAKRGRHKEFEQHYSASGVWTELFRKAEGYIDTLCLRDSHDKHRYLVVDRWKSVDAFGEFKLKFAEEYRALDEKCTAYTTAEKQIGYFEGD